MQEKGKQKIHITVSLGCMNRPWSWTHFSVVARRPHRWVDAFVSILGSFHLCLGTATTLTGPYEASTEGVGTREPVSESALRVSIFKISAVVLIILNTTAGGLGIRWQTVCWHRGTISCSPSFSLGLQIGHQPPTHACRTSYPSSGRHHS